MHPLMETLAADEKPMIAVVALPTLTCYSEAT